MSKCDSSAKVIVEDWYMVGAHILCHLLCHIDYLSAIPGGHQPSLGITCTTSIQNPWAQHMQPMPATARSCCPLQTSESFCLCWPLYRPTSAWLQQLKLAYCVDSMTPQDLALACALQGAIPCSEPVACALTLIYPAGAIPSPLHPSPTLAAHGTWNGTDKEKQLA